MLVFKKIRESDWGAYHDIDIESFSEDKIEKRAKEQKINP